MLMHFAVCGQYPSNQCTEVGGWSVSVSKFIMLVINCSQFYESAGV